MTQLADLMLALAPLEGVNKTRIEGIHVFKATQYRPREPLCYNQGILIVGQGAKRIYLGGKTYDYNPETYLVLTVPIPAECETNATPDEPLLLITIDFDMAMLTQIIALMDSHFDFPLPSHSMSHKGLYLSKATSEIKATVLRLLKALHSPLETDVLGKGILHELLFWVMCGENASSLYALAMKNTYLARIDKALRKIHSGYNESMDVDGLASLVNMSPSTFHRTFKTVTSSSPIQYIKKIRLNKAKDLLSDHGIRVNEAASRVGYESATQFSREFKRYFGYPPVECSLTAKALTHLNS